MKKLILTIALLTSIGAQAKENNIVSILVGSGPTGGIINNVTTKGLARGTVEGLMYQHRIKNSELFLGVLLQSNQTYSISSSIAF